MMKNRTLKIMMILGFCVLAAASILGFWRLYGTNNSNAASKVAANTSEKPESDGQKVPEKEEIPAKMDQETGTGATAVPPDLVDAGEYAENIYDAAKTGNWTMADAKLEQLQTSIDKLNIKKIDARTLSAMLPELKAAISGRKSKDVLFVSNKATFAAAEMSGKYKTAVPIQITKLDFYGRELEIWAGEGDIPKLQETAREIRKTWDQAKPAVESKNGAKVSAVFENLVKRTESAKTSEDYSRLATPILDEVDNLEKVFE